MAQDHSLLKNFLHQAFQKDIEIKNQQSVGGGCINNAIKLVTNRGTFFLKWNDDRLGNLFEAEAKGLEILLKANEITIPRVHYVGNWNNKKFILMEFIDSDSPGKGFWVDFGRKLANLHRKHLNNQYGLDHDNFIGSLPQHNSFHGNWVEFFMVQRLEFQLQLAIKNQLVDSVFAKRYRAFYTHLPALLPDQPASLLHGDLWSGNFMVGRDGYACLIDPAVYYGNREIEIAFTKMFGGFDVSFYKAYHDTYPMEQGFEERIDIYNLYPSMVHVNLFGTSYLAGVDRVLRKFL